MAFSPLSVEGKAGEMGKMLPIIEEKFYIVILMVENPFSR